MCLYKSKSLTEMEGAVMTIIMSRVASYGVSKHIVSKKSSCWSTITIHHLKSTLYHQDPPSWFITHDPRSTIKVTIHDVRSRFMIMIHLHDPGSNLLIHDPTSWSRIPDPDPPSWPRIQPLDPGYLILIHLHCLWAVTVLSVWLTSCCPWCWTLSSTQTHHLITASFTLNTNTRVFPAWCIGYFHMMHTFKSCLNTVYVLERLIAYCCKSMSKQKVSDDAGSWGWGGGRGGRSGGREGNVAVSAATLRLRGSSCGWAPAAGELHTFQPQAATHPAGRLSISPGWLPAPWPIASTGAGCRGSGGAR